METEIKGEQGFKLLVLMVIAKALEISPIEMERQNVSRGVFLWTYEHKTFLLLVRKVS